MNNTYHKYNQGVPPLNHRNWSSLTQECESFHYCTNITKTIQEPNNNNDGQPPHSNTADILSHDNSNNPYYIISESELVHGCHSSSSSNSLKTLSYSIFDGDSSTQIKPALESFDYNHCDIPYRYRGKVKSSKSNKRQKSSYRLDTTSEKPPSAKRARLKLKRKKEAFIRAINKEIKMQLESNQKTNKQCRGTKVNRIKNDKKSFQTWISDQKSLISDKYIDLGSSERKKGLPKWIVDDMKKLKDREHMQTLKSTDFAKDDDRNNDDNRLKLSKHISTSHLATDPGFDDASFQDDDDMMENIDVSSFSLPELIQLLDDDELESIKITFFRDSLTDIMKEITDDLIVSVTKSAFSYVLNGGKKKDKRKSVHKDGRDETTVPAKGSTVISQVLGLDAYESEDESFLESADVHLETDITHVYGNDNDNQFVAMKMKLEPKMKNSQELDDLGAKDHNIYHNITEIKLELSLMELENPVSMTGSTSEIITDSFTKSGAALSDFVPCNIKLEPSLKELGNVSLLSSNHVAVLMKCNENSKKLRNSDESKRKGRGKDDIRRDTDLDYFHQG